MTHNAQHTADSSEILRYPPSGLAGDYIRSATGVAIAVGVLWTNPPSWTLGLIFGAVLLLFGGFGVRTLDSHAMRLRLTPKGLTRRGFRTRCATWADMQSVKLRYFGKRKRDVAEGHHQSGFFQLTLRGPWGRMRFESPLQGFDYLVWRAGKAARTTGIGLDPTTAENMLALDIDPDGEQRPPESVQEIAVRVGDPIDR